MKEHQSWKGESVYKALLPLMVVIKVLVRGV